jgi:hypothetical protein
MSFCIEVTSFLRFFIGMTIYEMHVCHYLSRVLPFRGRSTHFCAVGLVDCLHFPRYLFLNTVKCNVHTFFFYYLLVCVQTSPLLHLTKSFLFMVLLKYSECAVPCHISCTLPFNFNVHKTESTRYLRNSSSVCLGP